ncbi:MFS transporter [Mycobacterium sp. CBMA293]|uniref:MFS transporter n=1 Tax=unclassified Mycolicibacterium TaxID=2636767 RepID=UPI0012DE086A|nr:MULTISPECIES: MFS transporter [unclassified Mycolicibacterium]MUL49196.1 MFS transporter [Mycolicibacterium sp. CBMA 360]MUL60772.1 MFS transporter [Mycolicibacterium sp. CBMA 335]MUL71785.1 MFS transporter [Mycolicibacterium sp. CBMA 311]MUL95713.1 MFS transporter [Mycolicibacterium sp. CBMA 230]MUM03545.1 MFS transporter [Mycolicibacterium sp. CBMA 213]
MSRSRYLLFATICGVSVATIYSAQPMLTQIGGDLGVSPGRLGWIVTVGQLGYLLGLAFLVPLGDMRDRRTLIVGHLLLTAVGVAMAATATRTWVMLAGLAIAGLFSVVVQTTVAYAAAVAAPQERGRTLGVVTSGVVIGILGARIIAGAMAAAWVWRSVYATLAALLVTLALLVLMLLPADQRAGGADYRQALHASRTLLRDRLFLSRGLIAFFLFASFGALWSGLALPLTASPWHLSSAQIGLFGIAGLAGALGAGRAGRWADDGFAQVVTGAALTLLAASWLATAQASWALWLLIVGVIVLDFAVQAVQVSNQHLLATSHMDHASSVIGGYMLFYSVGSGVGAVTTTAAYSAAGWTGSSILGAAFAVGALAVWAANRRVAPPVVPSTDLACLR